MKFIAFSPTTGHTEIIAENEEEALDNLQKAEFSTACAIGAFPDIPACMVAKMAENEDEK